MKSASSRNLALSSLMGVQPQQQPLRHAIMSSWSPRCGRPPRRDLWHRALGGPKSQDAGFSCARRRSACPAAARRAPLFISELHASLCAAVRLRGARRVAEQPDGSGASASGSVSSPARLLRTAARRDAAASCFRLTFSVSAPSPGVRSKADQQSRNEPQLSSRTAAPEVCRSRTRMYTGINIA